MKRHFCTLFNKNYLAHFLSLYESLEQHLASFHVYALCMDNESYERLSKMSLANLTVITQSEFEFNDEALLLAKSNRTVVEYFFTCSPSLPIYVLKKFIDVDLITYLDADLYFFSTPEPLFEELGNNSIGIIAHKFYGLNKRFKKYGEYNVGWLSFKRDEQGMDCLNRWRNQCNEWCYDKLEFDRFADQKYLDQWPSIYKNSLMILENKGANVGPWNINRHHISTNNEKQILIDDKILIFYHFASFKQIKPWLFKTNCSRFLTWSGRVLRKNVYGYYLKRLMYHGWEINQSARKNFRLGTPMELLYNIFVIVKTFVFIDYLLLFKNKVI